MLAEVPGTVVGTENLVGLKTNMMPTLLELTVCGLTGLGATNKYISTNRGKCYKETLQGALECAVGTLS